MNFSQPKFLCHPVLCGMLYGKNILVYANNQEREFCGLVNKNEESGSRVIISVLGQDRVGIIAGVSQILSEHNINILDISQTIMQGIFTMIMIIDMEKSSIDFARLKGLLQQKGEEMGLRIDAQHEKVFRYMHRI